MDDIITWTNPTIIPEPHTVSFVRDENYFLPLDAHFVISNQIIIKTENSYVSDPLILQKNKDKRLLVEINLNSISSTTIDSAGNNVTIIIKNYTYVNSGWI